MRNDLSALVEIFSASRPAQTKRRAKTSISGHHEMEDETKMVNHFFPDMVQGSNNNDTQLNKNWTHRGDDDKKSIEDRELSRSVENDTHTKEAEWQQEYVQCQEGPGRSGKDNLRTACQEDGTEKARKR